MNGPYVAQGAITTDFFTAYADFEIEISNLTRFDGAGRPVARIFQPTGTEKWRTTVAYGGDRVDVTPPAGGTPTSTVTDIRGRTVEVRQHNGAGGYDASTHAYDRKGQQTEVTDAMGNKWTYYYDLLGRQTSATDPDKGTTTSSYNTVNELVSTTDARGTTLAYAYDSLGRKVSVHDGTTAGTKRAEWTYDTLAKGQLTKSIRYDGGDAYVVEATGFDTGYRPTGTKITIPAAETGLAGTYSYTNTYRADGSPATAKLPPLTGLAAETLSYGYNHVGLPTTVQTDLGSLDGDPVWLVDGTGYTSFGELSTLGRSYNGGKWLDVGFIVDSRTRRVTEMTVGRGTTPATVANVKYSYDDAGNILSQQHTAPGAVVDTQCYSYDYLRRLTEAWTPASQDCASGPSAVGGPAPYWQTWTFDKAGNRLTQVDHGTAAGDRTTTSTYPAPGAARPHAVTGASTVDTAGTVTTSYTYDNAGNTVNRNGKALTWDAEGELTSNDGSSYVYDANGNRLIARDATGKTLYLPGQELRYTTSGGTKAGTRYYSHAGQTVAMCKGSTLTWLVNDHQGTAISTVLESSQAITVRRQLPYGGARGATVTWPNDKGLVGGTKDPTGLTHLGAREYDPDLGRFMSVDPLMDLGDPQQWNAYGYANGSPITMSDPDGLRPVSGENASDDSYSGVSWTVGNSGKFQATKLEKVDGYNQWGRPIVVAKTTKPQPSKAKWLFDQWMGIQSGSMDTLWNAAKGLAQLAWDCNTVSVAVNGGGCGVYDLAAMAVDDPGGAASLLWNGIAAPIVSDWNNGEYGSAAGRAGTEILMLVAGPKGAGGLARAGEVTATATRAAEGAARAGSSAGARAAVRPVGAHLESINDVLRNPRLLEGMKPAQVEAVLKGTPGWTVETLGRGSRKGQGWVFRQYNERGNPIGPQLRWHPGGGHHGPDPYWRVKGHNGDLGGIIRG